MYKKLNFELTLFLFFFAPFISLLLYDVLGKVGIIVQFPQILRDSAILITISLLMLSKQFLKKNLKIMIIFYTFLIVLIFYSFVSLSQYYNIDVVKSIINNIRRFLFPFLIVIYLIYMRNYINIEKIEKYLIFFWVFGIIEYFIPTSFWSQLYLESYYNNVVNTGVGSGNNIESFMQSGRMYTFDTYYLIGEKERRMISFYLEPTTLGSLAIGSLFLAYLKSNKLLIILSIVSGFLAFSKAFILVFLFFTTYLLLNKFKSDIILFFSNIIILFVLTLFLVIGYFIYINNPIIFELGFMHHLVGLYSYFEHFKFLGYGIGQVGSFAYINIHSPIGVESAGANIFSQLGIFSLLLYLFFFSYIKLKNNQFIVLLLISYIFMYTTSNSATGYSGNFLIFLVIIYYSYFGVKIKQGVFR